MGKAATTAKRKPVASKKASQPRKQTIGGAIPIPLERHIEDVLDPDTKGGQEDSAVGKLVRDWNAGKSIGEEHRPILLREARHLLSIIEDADEWQDYPEQATERRQLQSFIKRFQ